MVYLVDGSCRYAPATPRDGSAERESNLVYLGYLLPHIRIGTLVPAEPSKTGRKYPGWSPVRWLADLAGLAGGKVDPGQPGTAAQALII